MRRFPHSAFPHGWYRSLEPWTHTHEFCGYRFSYLGAPQPQFALPSEVIFSTKMSKPFEFNWIVDTDVQDIAENAVDMGHFTSVHRYLRMPVIREIWIKDHQLEITFDTQRRVFGWLTNVNISIHYYGLGVVVSHVKSGPAEVTVLYMPTPISDNKVHICMCVAFRKSTIPFANWFMRMLLPIEIATDFASDIPVWENKAYHLKPVLCAGDGPIMKMRKWAKQFYLPVTT